MVHQHRAAVMQPPPDLVGVIMRIIRARDAGLDVSDNAAITKLAKEVEHDLVPRINPDSSYRIPDLERWGLTHGFFYGPHRHLLRKDGRKTFVWGREVLAEIEAMPKLALHTVERRNPARERRGRARPPKNTAGSDPGRSNDERTGAQMQIQPRMMKCMPKLARVAARHNDEG